MCIKNKTYNAFVQINPVFNFYDLLLRSKKLHLLRFDLQSRRFIYFFNVDK